MSVYVKEDLTRFNDIEPAKLLSVRPVDDPLEDILYLTSVGEPSIIYETVRSLRLVSFIPTKHIHNDAQTHESKKQQLTHVSFFAGSSREIRCTAT
jgi:hypothetical protein